MEIATYRKYLVNTDKYFNKKCLTVLPIPFTYFFFENGLRNHPLVNKGIAYWINDHTLVIGYELKSNPQIFRPIYSHSREKKINELYDKRIPCANKKIKIIRRKKLYYELCRLYLPKELIIKMILLIY